MKTVVIFGGSGFVANHIIRQLVKNGYKILFSISNLLMKLKLKFWVL